MKIFGQKSQTPSRPCSGELILIRRVRVRSLSQKSRRGSGQWKQPLEEETNIHQMLSSLDLLTGSEMPSHFVRPNSGGLTYRQLRFPEDIHQISRKKSWLIDKLSRKHLSCCPLSKLGPFSACFRATAGLPAVTMAAELTAMKLNAESHLLLVSS